MAKRGARRPTQRQLRVAEVVRHALVRVLGRDRLRDPDLQGISITVSEVVMGPDLRTATVYVSPLGGADDTRIVTALGRAAPYLRGRVASEVTLKHVPRLVFRADTTFAYAQRIDSLLREPTVARDLGPDAGRAAGGEDGS